MARWLALIAVTQQVSCTGGTTSNPGANADPPPVVGVSISPSSAQIAAGASMQFTASVQNASNGAVNWQVNGIPGGNSSFGTIVASSPATASYTAPASVSGALTVTVSAVLQADPTKSASATVTINPQPGVQISVSPANVSVATGASLQFNAGVQNGPPAVIWEVNGVQGGTAKFGTISSSGFYTAPALIPTPPVVTITALLLGNLSVFGSTSLTIVAPPVSVSVFPNTANVISGQTLQFSATVQNSSAPLIWQVNGTPGGDAVDGTIAPTGTYAASYSAPSVSIPLTISVTAALQANPPISASAGVTVVPLNTFTGVYSWRNDNSLTGQNAQETALTPASVSSTTSPTFGKLFGCPVDGQIFAQPLYVANVTTPIQGTHNVIFVATENDSVYAFDAAATSCQILWQVSFIDPAMGITPVPANDVNLVGETDIVPVIGITGTPVIDPTTATLYVVAKTRVLQSGVYVYKQQLHALDLTTGWVGGVAGAEKYGAPSLVQVPPGSTFDSLTENQRSALLLAGSKIYVAFDSYGDTDPFHGWLLAYDAANLQTAPAVFNTTPNGSHGGIGQSGAAPSVDSSGNVFVATSDGTFDANLSGSDYAETLLKLQINAGSFSVADTFTPGNEAILNFTRNFFGSTGVLVLPDSLGTSAHPNLASTGDQAGNLYVVDRHNLGGFNSAGPVQMLSLGTAIFGTPAFWSGNNTVYVAAAGDNLRALPLTSGTLSAPSCSPPSLCSSDTFPVFGASPVVSWDGNNAASGIVWAMDTSGYTGNVATSSPAILHAYQATNLSNELYVSASSANGLVPAAGPAVKFAVPTIANGKVYVGTQNELSVFGLQ